MTWTGVILIASDLASFLSLSSNNRVSSFYWTRGSKLCFLTCFSYFSCYFLILVFLWTRYLLVYLHLSWLHGNLISCPIFSYLWHSEVVHCTCTPCFWHRLHGFLKARRSRESGSRLTTGFFPFLPFAKGFSCKCPLGDCASYLSYSQKSLSSCFLAWPKPPLSKAV